MYTYMYIYAYIEVCDSLNSFDSLAQQQFLHLQMRRVAATNAGLYGAAGVWKEMRSTSPSTAAVDTCLTQDV